MYIIHTPLDTIKYASSLEQLHGTLYRNSLLWQINQVCRYIQKENYFSSSPLEYYYRGRKLILLYILIYTTITALYQ